MYVLSHRVLSNALVLLTAGSWRDPPERDDPRGSGGRSHRGANDGHYSVQYDRGDYRRKRFNRSYDDDEDEDGATTILLPLLLLKCFLMVIFPVESGLAGCLLIPILFNNIITTTMITILQETRANSLPHDCHFQLS